MLPEFTCDNSLDLRFRPPINSSPHLQKSTHNILSYIAYQRIHNIWFLVLEINFSDFLILNGSHNLQNLPLIREKSATKILSTEYIIAILFSCVHLDMGWYCFNYALFLFSLVLLSVKCKFWQDIILWTNTCDQFKQF